MSKDTKRPSTSKRMIASKASGYSFNFEPLALVGKILVCATTKNKGRKRSSGNWMIAWELVRACVSQAKGNYIGYRSKLGAILVLDDAK